MKPFKGKHKEFTGQFDGAVEEDRDRQFRRRSKRIRHEDEEDFQPLPNHPADVSYYLDDDEDFQPPSRRT